METTKTPAYIANLVMLPDYMRQGMQDWIEYGRRRPPGGFLTALLSNDLRGTFEKADGTNVNRVRDYMVYLYNYAPMGSWGSVSAFENWNGLVND